MVFSCLVVFFFVIRDDQYAWIAGGNHTFPFSISFFLSSYRLWFHVDLVAGSSYRDILHCNKRPFYHKGLEDMGIMDAYIMHTVKHFSLSFYATFTVCFHQWWNGQLCIMHSSIISLEPETLWKKMMPNWPSLGRVLMVINSEIKVLLVQRYTPKTFSFSIFVYWENFCFYFLKFNR